MLLLHILSVDEMYGQADGTYTHNVEKLVRKVCALAYEKGDEHQRHRLRASSLQCLSAMVVLLFDFHFFTMFRNTAFWKMNLLPVFVIYFLVFLI